MKDLGRLMKKINIAQRKQIVLAGHFSLFYDSDLEDKGV